MDIALMHQLTEDFASYLSEVTDGDLMAATPCEHWNIGDLFHHMVAENIRFGRVIDPRFPPPAARDSCVLRETVYRDSARYVLDVLTSTLERTQPGPAPGAAHEPSPRDGFDLHLANTLLHTWDLAQAIDIEFEIPGGDVVDRALQRVRRLPPEVRGAGRAFKDVVEAPANSAMEELLLQSGRSPAWRATPKA